MPLGWILADGGGTFRPQADDPGCRNQDRVSKSLWIIGGLGLGGCFLLSLVMKQAVALHAERQQLPFLPALTAKFEAQLQAPLRLREEGQAGAVRLIASARVRPDCDRRRFADALAAEIWLHVRRAGSPARELDIQVRADKGEPLHIVSPRPAVGR
jgi:hypothetical protein